MSLCTSIILEGSLTVAGIIRVVSNNLYCCSKRMNRISLEIQLYKYCNKLIKQQMNLVEF